MIIVTNILKVGISKVLGLGVKNNIKRLLLNQMIA